MKGAAKVNNHRATEPDKVEIRRLVLDAVGRPAHVFDAFAGGGQMFRRVWCDADSYVGCDQRWYRDHRTVFVCDNRRALRTVDLGRFNVFDLDAWGSPWEQAIIVAARRKVAPGERIGLLLTEGTALKTRMGGMPAALIELTGFVKAPPRMQDGLLDRAIQAVAERMTCRIEARWQANGKTGASMRYVGLVLVGEG